MKLSPLTTPLSPQHDDLPELNPYQNGTARSVGRYLRNRNDPDDNIGLIILMNARYIRFNVTLTGVLGGVLTVTGPDRSQLRNPWSVTRRAPPPGGRTVDLLDLSDPPRTRHNVRNRTDRRNFVGRIWDWVTVIVFLFINGLN